MLGRLYGIKAQNFDATIYDTEDLSTIRGASFAAIDAIPKENGHKGVEMVSAGGSNGIYRLTEDQMQKVSKVKLAEFDAAKHLCFSDAQIDCTERYVDDMSRLSALHSRNQMRNRGVVYPDPVEGAATVCPVDLLSPAVSEKHRYKGEEISIGTASFDRRMYGLEKKQKFLERLATQSQIQRIPSLGGLHDTHSFAMLLSSISDGQNYDGNLKSTLRDKIAVIHFDGNGAGEMQKQLLQGAATKSYHEQLEVQRTFDQDLAALRQKLAEVVLDILHENKGHGPPSKEEVELRKQIKKQAERVMRFEALLWAGDEVTFIVPARLGWQVTQAILAVLEENKGSARIVEGSGNNGHLRGAIGLIYCHHDAPIARIRKLADRLCTHCKDVDRQKNLVFPMVLESFDHIGPDLDDYLRKRTPQKVQLTQDEINRFFVLDRSEMARLANTAKDKKSDPDVSRRKIRQGAYHAHRSAIIGSASDRREALTDMQTNMLIEEYWDYYPQFELETVNESGDDS